MTLPGIQTLEQICYAWIIIALAVHIVMFFVVAPFGRHTSTHWGVSINNKVAWFLMELPSLAIMVFFLFTGHKTMNSWSWILFVLWIVHYFNRTFVYPLRIRSTPKMMPLAIAGSAVFFNLVNAGLNGYYLSVLAPDNRYDSDWLMSFPFWCGGLLFVTGLLINWKADNMLIHLRKRGETGYRIPRGFLFEYVSSPNLFGEIIEWSGFALMAQNLPALTFMVWTLANLIPRAKNHHDWYLRNFPDYPKERKKVIPWIY